MLNALLLKSLLLSTSINSFKDYFTTQIGLGRMLLTFIMALVVGMIIFFIYKKTFAGVMYSRSLNVSYVMLTMVTALMLMLINNNLTLSLGMVGALSIIRFRTAIKDPIDTVFMFWAVGEGIAIGVAYFMEAFISVIVIGIIIIILSLFKSKASLPFILIIHYTGNGAETIKKFVSKFDCKVKSRSMSNGKGEMMLEIRTKSKDLTFVDKLSTAEGIIDVMVVSHNGDIVA